MRSLFACLALAAVTAAPTAAQILDPQLPTYRPQNELQGQLTLIGSTTMTSVAGVWVDSFAQYYPDVRHDIEIRGSRGAVPAVLSGEASFGLLSRKITEQEVRAFEQKFGYKPKVATVCLERIGIWTHRDNPVRQMTLAQVAAVLSGQAVTWGQVGATGDWANQPIRVHGRGPDTGSRVFIENALLRGADHDPVVEHGDNGALLDGVAADRNGVGYAGLIYGQPDVRSVAISRGEGHPAVAVDSLDAAKGNYVLVRPLQLVINQKPGSELPPASAEFIRYVLSRSGQEDVIKGGFQPIPARPAEIALDQVGLRALR